VCYPLSQIGGLALNEQNHCGILIRQINNAFEKKANTRLKETNLTFSQMSALIEILNMPAGKTTFKEEFVTCGGVDLKEIDMKRMESKILPGLYFCGEVINVDGITGGFNFQNAWSTAWICANAI